MFIDLTPQRREALLNEFKQVLELDALSPGAAGKLAREGEGVETRGRDRRIPCFNGLQVATLTRLEDELRSRYMPGIGGERQTWFSYNKEKLI